MEIGDQIGDRGISQYDDGDDLQTPQPPSADAEVGVFICSLTQFLRAEEPSDQDDFDDAAGNDADVVGYVICQIQEVQASLCNKQEGQDEGWDQNNGCSLLVRHLPFVFDTGDCCLQDGDH